MALDGVGGETGSGEDGRGVALWIRVKVVLEVVIVASPIPGALATAVIAGVRVGQVFLPLLLLTTSLLRQSSILSLLWLLRPLPPNVNSVAFAAYAGNDNGSGGGDFEKLLDMLLAEELEMWTEKENDSMDEGVQEDERFEIEIDNEETGGRESSSANEGSEEDDECWK